MDAQGKQMKAVYTVVERAPNKSFWTRVGIGFVNHDGSLNLKLDAIPTNGTLQVRDWEPAERRAAQLETHPEAAGLRKANRDLDPPRPRELMEGLA